MPRAAAGATGTLLGVAFGLMLAEGEFLAALTAILIALSIAGAVRAFVPASVRRPFSILIALAFAVHLAVLVVVHVAFVAFGRAFVTGDDSEYARVAWIIARSMHGEPTDFNADRDGHLVGTFTYAEGALFYLIGFQVLTAKIFNVGIALTLAFLVFDMARRIFNDVAGMTAAVLVAFYPSLVIWSSLNLKDTLAVLLVGLVLWAVLRFQLRPRALWLAALPIFLVPIYDLRLTIYPGLALAILLGLSTSPRMIPFRFVRAVMVLAIVLGTGWIVYVAFDKGIAARALAQIEYQREWMAVGANTAFGDSPALWVREGDTFVVREAGTFPWYGAVAVSSIGNISTAGAIHVGPDSRIASRSFDPRTAPQAVDAIRVNPGDVIVIGDSSIDPAAPERWRVLDLPAGSQVRLTLGGEPAEEVYARTLAHLPSGISHALFAPVPWVITRGQDLLVAPEMILWYVVLAAALVTVVRARNRWWLLLPPILFIGTFVAAMALTEGNTGTVYRHRSMIIPLVTLLAAPSLVWAGRRGLTALRRANSV